VRLDWPLQRWRFSLRSRYPLAFARNTWGRCCGTIARDSAPIDLTGYWVAYITENWRYRMVTPPKASTAAFHLPRCSADHQCVGPAADERAGNQCRSYGAGIIMSVPGRLHITWQDADTLRIDIDAGTQSRSCTSQVLLPPLLLRRLPVGRGIRKPHGRRATGQTQVAVCTW